MANYFPDINYELNDLHSVKVLICHLLNSIHKEVSLEELYEIAVGSEIINYFYYNEAIEDLLKTGAIEKKDKNGKEVIAFVIENKNGCIAISSEAANNSFLIRKRSLRFQTRTNIHNNKRRTAI